MIFQVSVGILDCGDIIIIQLIKILFTILPQLLFVVNTTTKVVSGRHYAPFSLQPLRDEINLKHLILISLIHLS